MPANHVRITLRRELRPVRVTLAGETIAKTQAAVRLAETGYPDRLYIPREDVAADVLAPSATHTHCPHKGEARYFDAVAGGRRVTDAAWAYEEPLDRVSGIAGKIAFDPERVDAIEVG